MTNYNSCFYYIQTLLGNHTTQLIYSIDIILYVVQDRKIHVTKLEFIVNRYIIRIKYTNSQ